MSPARLVVLGEGGAKVPVVDEPFWIGRDPGCDLCLWDLRVSRKHASIGQSHGEYVLTSEGRHGVFVNGAKVPVIPLRHGDRIDLTPPEAPAPVALRFENDLEGTFVPPRASRSALWLELERAKPAPGSIPGFEPGEPLLRDRADLVRARSRADGTDVVIRHLPPVPIGPATDSWLRLLTALAGATHPALARVVDGGLTPSEGGARRWMAVEHVVGRPASLRIAEGTQALVTVCRRMRALAAGLHLLHSRGVIHGGVRPSNLLLRTDGSAVLIGFGRAFVRRDGSFGSTGAPGEGAFVAPEIGTLGAVPTPATDVYGLAALTQAMATGKPVFAGDGITTPRGPRLKVAPPAEPLPPALEDLIARSVEFEIDARPTAEDFAQVLAYVEATLTRVAP